MSPPKKWLSIAVAMLAFAANSLLCREAYLTANIDASLFTLLRLASGAIMLLILGLPGRKFQFRPHADLPSALALFGYAILFAFAYGSLTAATGALILFASVQVVMLGHGYWQGERFSQTQLFALLLSLAGLVWLLSPGLQAPSLIGSLMMAGAGVCWAFYSIRGRSSRTPLQSTAQHFLLASAMAFLAWLLLHGEGRVNQNGVMLALASGGLASGLGYAVWYSVLPLLQSAQAAMLQVSVPVLATVGGVVVLNESLSQRHWLASAAILGGILLFIRMKPGRATG